MAPGRKRRRVEFSPEQEEGVQDDDEQPNEQPPMEHSKEKEQELWDSFKDEHVETIDQVPLTLQRQYSLIYDLDKRTNVNSANLLSTLLQYINKRRELKQTPPQENNASGTDTKEQNVSPNADELQDVSQRNGLPPGISLDTLVPETTTRQLLTKIACLADDLLRASEDKVNMAQAVHDSVNRQVRIIQQAIKEQEASITLGARPGHLAPENLSDLTVGRWVRPRRATFSPIDDEDQDEGHDDAQETLTEDAVEALGQLQISNAKKTRGKGRTRANDTDSLSTSPLTITLPAQAAADDDEVFCICKQGSFGECRPNRRVNRSRK
ncbi:hypothetical protein H0H92_007178 [Tricholoma furcatifolium]|nr:hypothetical protein H0H92_007178 [Tricholoma furcatifolium]